MRRVIDGKRYDTETGFCIGRTTAIEQGECASMTSYRYWEAALYRTMKGNYFLAGSGGPMTRFARGRPATSFNRWVGGSDIVPMRPLDAMAWAEEYLPSPIMENEFDAIVQDA